MFKPRAAITMGILAAVLLLWGTAVVAQNKTQDKMCVPMGDIAIQPLAKEPLRPVVNFPHSVHMSYDCQSCHHTWTGREMITGCSVSGCHDLEKMPDSKDGASNSKALAIKYYKNAYHQQCIGCHKEIAAKNQKAEATRIGNAKVVPNGPTGCKECHS